MAEEVSGEELNQINLTEKNYKIVLQYEGTRYSGWQGQGNTDNTIQEKIESILFEMVGYKVMITASGRTDAGVHAYGQVANFHIKVENNNRCNKEVMEYLNRYLPEDIAVIKIDEVDTNFHSRFNAKEKTYIYRIGIGTRASVFERNLIYPMEEYLDIRLMRECGELLVGTHDFKGFSTSKENKKSSIRTLYEIKIEKIQDEIRFTLRGNGFLYNMVRIIVGTLVEVGLGEKDSKDILDVINSRDRKKAGRTMPPQGLALVEVEY